MASGCSGLCRRRDSAQGGIGTETRPLAIVLLVFWLSMARLTPEEAAAKWAQRTAAASSDYAEGVERVTQAPGAKAAAKRQKWEAGIRDSAGKWERRVGSVSLEDWKQSVRDKGAARFAQGASAAEGKMAEFQREFQPHSDRVAERAAQMPDATLEDRIAKANFVMRENAKFQRGGGR